MTWCLLFAGNGENGESVYAQDIYLGESFIVRPRHFQHFSWSASIINASHLYMSVGLFPGDSKVF